jgi:hypothetical protein
MLWKTWGRFAAGTSGKAASWWFDVDRLKTNG